MSSPRRPARPVAVFVAGQPGSVKTLVVDLVHAALQQRGGTVRADRDTYKSVHPHYTALLAKNLVKDGYRAQLAVHPAAGCCCAPGRGRT